MHDLKWRLKQLSGISRFVTECESDIEQALFSDIGKPAAEVQFTELAIIRSELKYIRNPLRRWMQPKRVPTILPLQPGISRIYPEPLGKVLIIAPWNYPIQLTLVPLIGALAAGNCVVIKPSEMAPATSHLLANKLPQYLDQQTVQIVEGGVAETTTLLAEPFDHIFYTGNPTVGRIVMEAAAKHLTPVTLELGGKCPCIVDRDADIDVAAKRIVWTKFCNAGQSCVAPDYVLVHESIETDLISAMQNAIKAFYGDDPARSHDYGRIINQRHHARLMALLSDTGEIVTGGNGDAATRYIAPTLLRVNDWHASIMQEEIFGPLLPIIKVNDVQQAIQQINQLPKPLALYLFSGNRETQQRVIENTSSGSVAINHCMLQLAVPTLPFGGVGQSGMGAYHGKASFDTFSHYKSVFYKPIWPDLSIFYPPYRPLLKKLLRWFI